MTRGQILFWNKVLVGDGCWLWTASTDGCGYGRLKIDGYTDAAHRVSYQMMVGPIPDGLELDHLCRTPSCVRPSHLEAVTHKENVARGSSPIPLNAFKTHCPRGHEYTEENTYWQKNGTNRVSRICKDARMKAWWARGKMLGEAEPAPQA